MVKISIFRKNSINSIDFLSDVCYNGGVGH